MRFFTILFLTLFCGLSFAQRVMTYNYSSGIIDDLAKIKQGSGLLLNSDLKTLTPGQGLSGAGYNGLTSQTWNIDESYLENKIEELSTESFVRIVVDTSGGVCDAEFKLMDLSTRECSYWFTTALSRQGAGSGYLSHPLRDAAARAWFYCADIPGRDGRLPVLYEPKIFSSIGQQASWLANKTTVPEVGGIVIEPNVDGQTQGGEDIAPLFDDANSAPLTMRLTATDFVKSSEGNIICSPASLSYVKTRLANPKGYKVLLDNEDFSEWSAAVPTGWSKGTYCQSIEHITSGLPTGYTSGVRLQTTRQIGYSYSGVGFINQTLLPNFQVGKTYIVAVGFWVKRESSLESAGFTFGMGYTNLAHKLGNSTRLDFNGLSTSWQYVVGLARYTPTASNYTVAPGFLAGATVAQDINTPVSYSITGLTLIILEDITDE